MSDDLRIPPPPDASGVVSIDTAKTAKGPQREWLIVDYTPQTFAGGEVFLPGLWKRMHDDNTFELFFHEGPEMNFWQFVALLSEPSRKVQLVLGHNEKGDFVEHAGFVILDQILNAPGLRRAVGNFVFFKEYWNRHDSLDLGWAVLNHWFGKLDADNITGVTPEPNRAAIMFAKRLGFVEAARIPDFTVFGPMPCAGVFTYMTRQMWRDGHQKHFGRPPVENSEAT